MNKVILVALALGFLFAVPHVAASPSAVIQNDSSYTDSIGYYHVVGEVLNTGDASLTLIKISGVFKDSGSQVVDTELTYAYADYLPAGQKTPFDLFISDTQRSAHVASYNLALEYEAATQTIPIQLTIQGTTSSTDSLGFLEVVGQVQNSGQTISNFTKVVGTFYDQAGKVIDVEFSYTSPSDVPAGQAYGFKLTVANQAISSRVANYALLAESRQYTSVPEFLWPFILLAAALTLTVVATRKKIGATPQTTTLFPGMLCHRGRFHSQLPSWLLFGRELSVLRLIAFLMMRFRNLRQSYLQARSEYRGLLNIPLCFWL